MKYWFCCENEKRPSAGITAIFSDDGEFLLRLESSAGQNLSPWLRRRDALATEKPLQLLSKRKYAVSRTIFRKLIGQVKAARQQGSADVRVHEIAGMYGLHVASAGRFSTALVEKWGDLRNYLRKICTQMSPVHLTCIGKDLRTVEKLKGIYPDLKIRFNEEYFSLNAVTKTLRSVLVLTNLSGPALPWLGLGLEFWSKGLQGFRFRHIYGQLSERRFENTLLGQHWDLIVYRGHAEVHAGSIAWLTPAGLYTVPAGIASAYIHSACLPGVGQLSLKSLPAAHVLAPTTYLADFDDSALVKFFLTRYKSSAQVESAFDAVQDEYSQFLAIHTFSSTA